MPSKPAKDAGSAAPLLVDGVLYFTITDNVWAMDALTGRELWHYTWPNNKAIHVANRGVAMYKGGLYFMTPDDYLVSLNAKDGTERWRVQIADVNLDFFGAGSPLVIGNHVLIGPGNNDNIRAWLESVDPETGALQWKWWSIPTRPAGIGDMDRCHRRHTEVAFRG